MPNFCQCHLRDIEDLECLINPQVKLAIFRKGRVRRCPGVGRDDTQACACPLATYVRFLKWYIQIVNIVSGFKIFPI